MAILNATDCVLSITTGGSYQAVAHCTSASLSMNMELRDSTTKSSTGWQSNLGGLRSWELSSDAFVEIGSITGADIEELWTIWEARTEVAVKFGHTNMEYTGNALITSISIESGVEENATYSISLTGSGALAKS
jgi:TP901-1 family phage major tail protein